MLYLKMMDERVVLTRSHHVYRSVQYGLYFSTARGVIEGGTSKQAGG
jgi:hypothetical protein